MTKKSGLVVILSTTAPEEAPVIAEKLVAEHLVACVNILPVRSIYRWQEKTCDDEEQLLIMKTTEENAGTVTTAIKKLHSYVVPEIIVLPVTGGYPPYLGWVARETGSRNQGLQA
ncbi:MAG: Divalent-cation tolerance protein CutA [Methanoregula sp. PtaU1.Bin051]|nr:MAG: Divalent-cation tolerance protein CutA [Methanoregula sp. PtaU1.Bin051]